MKARGAKLLLAAATTLLASAAAFGAWLVLRRPHSSALVQTHDPTAAAEQTWNGQQPYVVDPVAGLRCRSSSTVSHPMTGLDASDPQVAIEKKRDANAFLREHELPSPLDRPTVLLVGDSHIEGVVSTPDNVSSLLEAASAPTSTPYYCLNAGCGFYSLWQHVLRARDLLPKWKPRVVVIVVFLGNDFLDLDNTKVPHLDDELNELPGAATAPPETTSARFAELALTPPHDQAFWQGLNQALRLHREPARLEVWMRKAAHAVAAMETAARQHDAKVVWVLLPSCDLVFPQFVRGLSPLAGEVTDGGAQRRVRDAFAEVLAKAKVRVVDAEPAFRKDGSLALYAIDYHIYRRGHRVLAELLTPVVGEMVAR